MLSNGKVLKSGDVIPYIICKGTGDGNNLSAVQRAFHPSEVVQQSLQVDVTYYLQNQLHPVISRLCEPIDGLDSEHLAQWVGLDPKAYTPLPSRDAKYSYEDENDNKAHRFKIKCSRCDYSNLISKKVSYICIPSGLPL
jgi:DNA polymerase alpha subunit A